MRLLPVSLTLCGALLTGVVAQAAPPDAAALIREAMAGEHRDLSNRERDGYRHPLETLQFFGWQPEMQLVEVWPGSGWYSELLAPITRPRGRYHAAGFDTLSETAPAYRARIQKAWLAKLVARPEVYDHTVVTTLGTPLAGAITPPGSQDMVLTFRNVHNWLKAGSAPEMFAAFASALKPGGILGVVEHRANPGTSLELMKQSGYVTEAEVIRLAEAAGFELADRSEINANPADSKAHPDGVWSLPPTLKSCQTLTGDEQLVCQAPYRAVGESDRMTLKFRKWPSGG
ncbi:MAG: methyltransferase [Gammaproteobacteria bacterium]|nr:methyltransferase [Gammaproteobacteria bacterium]